MPLSRLLYFSENQLDSSKGPTLRQLTELMKVSQRNNQAQGITGALIFDQLWFIQALEGERSKILALYEHLKDDERHANVSMAALEDVEERIFGNWWMGLLTRNEHTLPAFEPYLRKSKLNPSEMTGREILALISSVAKLSSSRIMGTIAA